ncbi:MAG TPA: hypothetical protein VMF61_15420 [Candidatus Acidoferrales bacterium]|nr:hypothetical protein [Candidatus Acidoferrales bacterium]
MSAGLPATTLQVSDDAAAALARLCPTRAIVAAGPVAEVDPDRCVLCMRCRGDASPVQWRHDVQVAHGEGSRARLGGRFARSLHVRIVDAGDCGSCLNELAQLAGPSYNLHRFGIFITPTPRQADVLLVVGPVTRQMREPLIAAYEAMPEPKRVVAVGACAASGGIFGPSLMCGAGAAEAVPVDLVVPGCPPSPYAVLAALREVCGQKQGRAT